MVDAKLSYAIKYGKFLNILNYLLIAIFTGLFVYHLTAKDLLFMLLDIVFIVLNIIFFLKHKNN